MLSCLDDLGQEMRGKHWCVELIILKKKKKSILSKQALSQANEIEFGFLKPEPVFPLVYCICRTFVQWSDGGRLPGLHRVKVTAHFDPHTFKKNQKKKTGSSIVHSCIILGHNVAFCPYIRQRNFIQLPMTYTAYSAYSNHVRTPTHSFFLEQYKLQRTVHSDCGAVTSYQVGLCDQGLKCSFSVQLVKKALKYALFKQSLWQKNKTQKWSKNIIYYMEGLKNLNISIRTNHYLVKYVSGMLTAFLQWVHTFADCLLITINIYNSRDTAVPYFHNFVSLHL